MLLDRFKWSLRRGDSPDNAVGALQARPPVAIGGYPAGAQELAARAAHQSQADHDHDLIALLS